MQLLRRLARLAAVPMLLVSCVAVIAAASPPASAATRATASQDGWVRIAHLSPEAPAMDIYLYPFGDPAHPTVLRDVSYGDVSAYMALAPGQYTVAMRGFDAPATSHPALVSSFMVSAKTAYTVAALGPDPGLRVEVFQDQTSTPKGQALVRVVQASLKEDHVTVSYGSTLLATQLAFSSATQYTAVSPGVHSVTLTASGDDATMQLGLTADTVHTIVVLDSSSGLKADDLTDAVGSQLMPSGGAATGFGGTALRPAANLAPWLLLTVAGGLLIAAGAAGLGWPRSRTRVSLSRVVAGVGQHPAQIGNHLNVDVLAGRRIKVFQLVP
jgi:Domain of unknown function (DUF4397)